ncbi:intermediate transcription factor VITF-3 [Deerpox virus W-848-83]|uniref:Intermediate transcription factor 3 small subunit n=1 Tax=Deerpox virus (strain Mule deer/United States/W-848-83/1983) TaxID=305674 RepID=Q08FP4_DPV83|nr:Intermediate transcription factor VITF-3 [Deerpox virus W-848-83]ABI99263.1 intermediate transcription factor VITF-3 [Deerpox virus W-848-83]
MFDPVPDLNLEANIEIGDVNVENTKSNIGESPSYISRSKRLYIHKTKDEERRLSLRFFLPRIYFLSYKEVNYLFRCIDAIKDVCITKKNNVIVAPYMILLIMSSKGYKLTESMIELFFPELYNENSKKFKFSSQVCIIQEKLGYPVEHYHKYDFEVYYSTIALSIRKVDETDESESEIFNTRQESEFVSSLSEITYRFYIILLMNNMVQWSSSTASIINQMVNTVLITVYELIKKCNDEPTTSIHCKLSNESNIPVILLLNRINLLEKFIVGLQSTKSFKISKRDKELLLNYFY